MLMLSFVLAGCKAETPKIEPAQKLKSPTPVVRDPAAVTLDSPAAMPDDKKELLEDFPDEDSAPAVAEFDALISEEDYIEAEFDALREEDYIEAEFDSAVERGYYEAEFDSITEQDYIEAEFDAAAEGGYQESEFDSIEKTVSEAEFDSLK